MFNGRCDHRDGVPGYRLRAGGELCKEGGNSHDDAATVAPETKKFSFLYNIIRMLLKFPQINYFYIF